MNSQKINIIIVTVYFPPVLSVASNRMIAFAKYLDKQIYNVSVVSLAEEGCVNYKDENGFNVYYIQNHQLFGMAKFQKKAPFIIHKMKAAWNKTLIKFNLQGYKSWEKGAYRKVKELIQSDSKNVLISSFPTEEPIFVCNKIKREFSDVQWIADLRDSITINPYLSQKQRKNSNLLEKSVLENADAVLSVSEPILADLKKKLVRNNLQFVEMRNGFDFTPGNDGEFNQKFTLTYAGTFYAERNPSRFFNVLINLIEKNKISLPIVNFVGVSGGIVIPKPLREIVHCFERIEYEKVVPILKNSDALLLIQPGSEYKGLFSGKIFDYLGVMRPVIALVDKDDVAAQLIKECNAGFVASFNDDEEIEKAILGAYQLWQNKQCLEFNKEIILKHQRSRQVQELGKLILSLVS